VFIVLMALSSVHPFRLEKSAVNKVLGRGFGSRRKGSIGDDLGVQHQLKVLINRKAKLVPIRNPLFINSYRRFLTLVTNLRSLGF